tara:strand:- start:403733 stop:404764 length:1032 start_codon:yes stop_codon:yes gene_type:complete
MPQRLSTLDIDTWQQQLRDSLTSGPELLKRLRLEPQDVGFSADACRDFALRVPLAFVERMEAGNPEDPLLMQVLATRKELINTPGYSTDPVGESGTINPNPGVIHKYQGRVLLIVSGGCAVNCRYCFRRHFPYEENQNSRQQWQRTLDYIARDQSITEVILSGGDPLVASDSMLAELVGKISQFSQVKRLRIHTRLPVVIPDRVTSSLLDAVTSSRLKTVVVIHCNHSNEIDASLVNAIAHLRSRDITVLNQSVLLSGINDSADALVELSEGLFGAGVLPYYLHVLDKVQGAAHFDMPAQDALRLHREITARLPGYLVPRLVSEISGEPAKTLLGSTCLDQTS